MELVTKKGNSYLGETLELAYGDIELAVTLEVGPRIISFQKKGGVNVMFQDVKDEVSKDVSATYGEGQSWHIYGGHRSWLSPEDETTYYPDNNPVEYTVEGNKVKFVSDWKMRGVRMETELDFVAANTVNVIMRAVNTTAEAQKLCLWALTVLKCGGVVEVPLSTRDTGYLANRNLVFWHYDDVNDFRFRVFNDSFKLSSSTQAKGPFKVGTYLSERIVANYSYGDTVFTKEVVVQEGDEPDFCCNMETYTSHLIHEVETLSPIKTIAAGDALEHVEIWKIK